MNGSKFNDLGMVNKTAIFESSLGELDQAEKRFILDWSFKCTLLA